MKIDIDYLREGDKQMFGFLKKKVKEEKPKSVTEMNQIEYRNYLRSRFYHIKENIIQERIKEEENKL